MKHSTVILLFIAIGLLALGAACGSGITQEEFDTMVSERDAGKVSALALETQLADKTTEIAGLKQQTQDLSSNVEGLESDLGSLIASIARLEGEVSQLQQQKQQLETSLTNVEDSLQIIQSKYPPKAFSSRSALETWLAKDDISERDDTTFAAGWYSKALELQRRAAEDGYLISAEFVDNEDGTFLIWCSSVTEDSRYYWWDPETDELIFQLNVEAFE